MWKNSKRSLNHNPPLPDQEEFQLPPWPKRRRVLTSLVMMGLILCPSLLIGVGMYQIGLDLRWIRKPFSKQTITEALLNDAGFVRAVRKSVMEKKCTNSVLGFEYFYQPPFVLSLNNPEAQCTQLVTVHSTGVDVLVTVRLLDEARERVVARYVEDFSTIKTIMMDGTKYPTSYLSGIRQGIATDIFVIGINRKKSYEITYAPTDPTLTGKVLSLVESFYSMPQ